MKKGMRGPGRAPRRARRRPLSPIVEQAEPRVLLATITVNSPDDVIAVGDEVLTLREAVALANGALDPNTLSPAARALIAPTIDSLNNANGQPDTIAFDIPGTTDAPPHVIVLGSRLTITTGQPLVIDGTTEPDFDAGANVPAVVLDGGGAVDVALEVSADGSEVRGLAIGGFTDHGIRVSAVGVRIAGNVIGLDAEGAPRPNGDGDPGDAGIVVLGPGATVGGTAPGDRNVIAANRGVGVLFSGGASTGLVAGNLIGTGPDGTTAMGNAGDGVRIGPGASGNTVGAAVGNRIGFNAGAGVRITGADSSGNVVAGNRIFESGGVGIDLIDGANAGLASPTITDAVIASVAPDAFTVTLAGIAPSGNGPLRVELFADSGDDPEGRVFLGVAARIAAGQPFGGTFDLSASPFPGGIFPANLVFTASATDADGNTSEFSGPFDPFLVTTNADDGPGSLRRALGNANVLPGTNRVGFAIAGSAVILVGASTSTPLPAITDTVVIDATTQAGFAGTPIVGLDGGDAIAVGLRVEADGSTVRGLAVGRFVDVGILIDADGTLIAGNFVGLDAEGIPQPNGSSDATDAGIAALGGDNTIGGTSANRNVIAANRGVGVLLSGAGASRNLVAANAIGTDPSGTMARGNVGDGVRIAADASGNTVGASSPAVANVISGNQGHGVALLGGGNTVSGNLIGTDLAGTLDLGNGMHGVLVDGPSGNRITANTISSNDLDGVRIRAGGSSNTVDANAIAGNASGVVITDPGTTANRIAGNRVASNGLDGVRIQLLAPANTVEASTIDQNGRDGVRIESGASANVVGVGNTIVRNAAVGVRITGADSSANRVVGNAIGTDPDGDGGLGNGAEGVRIESGARANSVGGPDDADRNVISGNIGAGVLLSGADTSGNVVAGNRIGTGPDGTTALGNSGGGVALIGTVGNTVGGMSAVPRVLGPGNLVSGNAGDGIRLQGATGAVIAGNFVGTDRFGTMPIGNAGDGIALESSVGVLLGLAGDSPLDLNGGNLVSANAGAGIRLSSGSSANILAGNLVGTDADGTLALGNALGGILLASAPANTIGGASAEARNLVSGNAAVGVSISGPAGGGNLLRGLYAGSNADGTAALPNGSVAAPADGLALNTLGNAVIDSLVSANTGVGIRIAGAGASANVVSGTLIGTDATGTIDLGNAAEGVRIEAGASANTIGTGNLIAFNAIGVAIVGGGTALNRVDSIRVASNDGDGVLVGPSATANAVLNSIVSGNGAFGVNLASGGNTVSGSVVSANVAAGILITSAGNAVRGNRIAGNGSDGVRIAGAGASANEALGNRVESNGRDGVRIEAGASANVVGGTSGGDGNVLVANAGAGVCIAGTGTSANLVAGNLIGIDADSTADLGNLAEGVRIESGAAANIIGSGNLISFNAVGIVLDGIGTSANRIDGSRVVSSDGDGDGIRIEAGASANTVSGTRVESNGGAGVRLAGAVNNLLIGNAIADNGGDGVRVEAGSSSNTASGLAVSGNAGAGVVLDGTGTTANLLVVGMIRGNAGDGVRIEAGASANTASGSVASANGGDGVRIASGAVGNLVAGAVVSGNAGSGIVVNGDGTSGNLISDSRVASNAGDGIRIEAGAHDHGVRGNALVTNAGAGVRIAGEGTSANLLSGNLIGTDPDRTTDLGNAGPGILIEAGASENTVSGNQTSAFNAHGVVITDPGTSANRIAGGLFEANDGDGIRIQSGASGTIVSGVLASGNAGAGIRIVAAADNVVADSKAVLNAGDGLRIEAGSSSNRVDVSRIVANGGAGAVLSGAGTTANLLTANTVTNNAGDGVRIEAGAAANTVGSGGFVDANSGSGVVLSGAGTAANRFASGSASANAGDGVRIERGASANTVSGSFVSSNATAGVRVADASGNLVTTSTIASNASGGLRIEGGSSANTVSGAVISRNDGTGVVVGGVGTMANLLSGLSVAPNTGDGIRIELGASANTVSGVLAFGGDGVGVRITAASGNLVAASTVQDHRAAGILIEAGASANTVSGVLAFGNDGSGVVLAGEGTSANLVLGSRIVANEGDGVRIESGASANTVGGQAVGTGNAVVSGAGAGVRLTDPSTSANLVLGNLIGTDVAGSSDLGNADEGVLIAAGASANTVGPGNTIAFNADGVVVIGGSSGNLVAGNRLASNEGDGLRLLADAPGNRVVANLIEANRRDGVRIEQFASANTIGGGNTVSGNLGDGIALRSGATANLVADAIVRDNRGDGIRIDDAPANSIRGGAVSGNETGVRIAGSSANRVDGGRIDANRADGLAIEAGSSANTVGTGIVITRNVGDGVRIDGPGTSANLVVGGFIGTDATGTVGLGNSGAGIVLRDGASANTVGGANPDGEALGDGNVISGNAGFGVRIDGDGTRNNRIAGNRIGTDPDGDAALPNAGGGLAIVGAPSNVVGGADPSLRNLISGNGEVGVSIGGPAAIGNIVRGNFIGTVADGSAAVGNWGPGLVVDAGSDNVIGGITASAGNVISGNAGDGVVLRGGASGNVVSGNSVGLDADGSASVGNGGSGVLIAGASGNLVGGLGNVVAGNVGFGIIVAGADSSGNLVRSNRIGTNAAGAAGMGNRLGGVAVLDARSSQLVGNVVADNGGIGIALIRSPGLADGAGADGTLVADNLVGVLDDAGTARPNAGIGLLLDAATDSTVIANLIGRGRGDAIRLINGATRNDLRSNLIGTDRSGNAAAGNLGSGVLVIGSSSNTLADNVVSSNGGFGVAIALGSSGNRLERNTVGTNRAGDAGMGNGLDGVAIIEADGNTLADNLVSGNAGNGVVLRGVGSSGNTLVSNTIGLARGRMAALGNAGIGVRIDGAPGNTVGGPIGPDPTLNGLRNALAGNLGDEVSISGPEAVGNVVIDNLIGTIGDGRASAGDPGSGILIDRGAAGNVASGNVLSGLSGFGVALLDGARGNRVAGGVIGTVPDGSNALGNDLNGVLILDAADNFVGDQDGVLIAANGRAMGAEHQANVRIAGAGSTGNLVVGSLIGTDRAGIRSLDPANPTLRARLKPRRNDDPNVLLVNGVFPIDAEDEFSSQLAPADRTDPRSIGVLIDGGASANTVGAGNLLSGNRNGVEIRGASRNVVQGNRIGPDASGTRFDRFTQGIGLSDPALGNDDAITGNGNGVLLAGAADNVVDGNIVGGNLDAGVRLDDGSTGNQVTGNRIGTDDSETLRLPNQVGVLLYGASANTIGGNVIAAHPAAGVHLMNAASVFAEVQAGGADLNRPGMVTTANVVRGNLIGAGRQGAVALPNLQGVLINDAPRNLVSDNTIAGNLQVGVQLFGGGAEANTVSGNAILNNGQGVQRQGFGVFLNQVPAGTLGIGLNDFRGNRADTGSREQNEGPTLQAIRPLPDRGRITRIEVVFNGYIDPQRAIDPANYRLTIGGVPSALTPVEYDERSRRVILRIDGRQPGVMLDPLGNQLSGDRFQFTVVGARPNGLRSTTPQGQVIFLDGNFDGATGDNFTRNFVGTIPQEPIVPSGTGRRVPRRPPPTRPSVRGG